MKRLLLCSAVVLLSCQARAERVYTCDFLNMYSVLHDPGILAALKPQFREYMARDEAVYLQRHPGAAPLSQQAKITLANETAQICVFQSSLYVYQAFDYVYARMRH